VALQLVEPVAPGHFLALPHDYGLYPVAPQLTLEEAQEHVLGAVKPLPAELVPITEAGGRVTAEDVQARVDLPPFPSSAMDGFAVRAADLPGTLRIAGESAAGRPHRGQLESGCAVAISTGAVVPEGADAVVPVEVVVK
jgi:molybdopterin molybdotransferase